MLRIEHEYKRARVYSRNKYKNISILLSYHRYILFSMREENVQLDFRKLYNTSTIIYVHHRVTIHILYYVIVAAESEIRNVYIVIIIIIICNAGNMMTTNTRISERCEFPSVRFPRAGRKNFFLFIIFTAEWLRRNESFACARTHIPIFYRCIWSVTLVARVTGVPLL